MIIKKKRIRKKKIKFGFNHGYGRLPNTNRLLSYFGAGLIFVSFGIAFYYLNFSDLPLADKAEYEKENIIIGSPPEFDFPGGEI